MNISIFWKNGRIIGTCKKGNEDDFIKRLEVGNQRDYDNITSSTEDHWRAYARHRAGNWPPRKDRIYLPGEFERLQEEYERNESEAWALL